MNTVARRGFSILAVLWISLFVAGGAVAIFQYKRLVDESTHRMYIKNIISLAVDSIRDQIMAVTRDSENKDEVINFINGPLAQMQIPISGIVSCTSSDPCVLYIAAISSAPLESSSGVALPPVTPTALATAVSFKIAFKRVSDGTTPKGIAPKIFRVTLPELTVASTNTITDATALMCNSMAAPIFRGTQVNGTSISPICVGLPAGDSFSFDFDSTHTRLKCRTNDGYWMAKINNDLTPHCVKFPNGLTSAKEVGVNCPTGQYSQSVQFDSKFQVIPGSVQCKPKGGPYDFAGTNRQPAAP